MKILLTGSEGFIGSHVYDQLKAEGHDVIGVDCMEPRVHGEHPIPERTDHVLHYGDIPYHFLEGVDVIVHLAAQVSVADSMKEDWRYHRHNTQEMYDFMGTVRAWVGNGHRLTRFVVASSSSVYGDVELPFREDGPTDPCNVYGLTKLDQEKLALMWGRALHFETVALRLFNVYGPGQCPTNPYTGVLANFARMLLHGESPQITEDGQQVRDFTYVEDVADAIVKVATKPESCQHRLYNVCTGIPTTMAEATHELALCLDRMVEATITGDYRVGDQRHVLGSPHRLFREFGWVARHPLDGVYDYAVALRRAVS